MPSANLMLRSCLTAALASLVMSDGTSGAASNGIPDSAINAAIDRELISDKAVGGNFIDVRSADGIVTLSGTVDNILAKKRALYLTETIKGVKSVVDELKVSPEKRSDEEVREDVARTLADDPAVGHYAIKAAVKDGALKLTGTVANWVEQHLAQTVAESVRGVKSVNNEIVIQPGTKLTDVEVKSDLMRQLEYDAQLDGTKINVEVKDGTATLSGTLGCFAEKARAEDDAMGAGAATVADLDLVVDWAARDKMRRDYPPVFKTDREIETALRETFRDDPRVAAFQTHASVEDGIATLSGVVNNLMAKQAAEEDARNTLGVWGVQNYLKVRPAQIPGDSELTARVKEALLRNAVTSLVPMAVRAIHGTVYLDGVIYSDYMRETASDVVYRVPGVVDLENNLLIGREPDVASIADWEIKANIRYRFNFSPRLDSSAIQVRVVDGIVTLEGVVDNELARRAAMDLARRAGARSIHDELTLKTGPPLSRSSDPAP